MRQRIYVDMDDTMCKFTKAHEEARARVPAQKFPQAQMDFFRRLEPIEGAIEVMNRLSEKFDVWILTRPSYINPLCYTEKRLWVEDHMGLDWCNKLILCPDKSLLNGDWLIDDVAWPGFNGYQLLFGSAWEGDNLDAIGIPQGSHIDWPSIDTFFKCVFSPLIINC